MRMTPGLHKFVLAVHLTFSVGWIGTVAAYLPFDVAVVSSQDAQTLRAAYFAMDSIITWAIVPFAFASLITGLVISLGTKWGLFRHFWVLISLLLTVVAIVVLLNEAQVVSRWADIAADPRTSSDALRSLGSSLLHSVGGLVVLLVITVLNVYKPRGLTRYGWRKQYEERARLGAATVGSRPQVSPGQ